MPQRMLRFLSTSTTVIIFSRPVFSQPANFRKTWPANTSSTILVYLQRVRWRCSNLCETFCSVMSRQSTSVYLFFFVSRTRSFAFSSLFPFLLSPLSSLLHSFSRYLRLYSSVSTFLGLTLSFALPSSLLFSFGCCFSVL